MALRSNAQVNVWMVLSIGLVFGLTLSGCGDKPSDDTDVTSTTLPPKPSESPGAKAVTISGSITLAGSRAQGFAEGADGKVAIAQSIADLYAVPVGYVEVHVATMSERRLLPSCLRRLEDSVKVVFTITIPPAAAPNMKEHLVQTASETTESDLRTALSSVLPRDVQIASVTVPTVPDLTPASTSTAMTTTLPTTTQEPTVSTTTTTEASGSMASTTKNTVEATTTTTTSEASEEQSTTASVKSSTTSESKTTSAASEEQSTTASIKSSTTSEAPTTQTVSGSTTSSPRPSATSTTSTLEDDKPLLATEIAVPAEQGELQIQTHSVAGFKVGMEIVIDPDTPRMEFNSIRAFGTIDLNTPLLFSHPAGTAVQEKTSKYTTTSSDPCIVTTTQIDPCMPTTTRPWWSVFTRKFEVGRKSKQPGSDLVGWGMAGCAVMAVMSMIMVAGMRYRFRSSGRDLRYTSMPGEEGLPIA